MTKQSMGQAWVLHALEPVRAGQALPPWATATTTLRLRAEEPLPQLTVQSVQRLNPDTTQSIGQTLALHSRSSLV